MRTLSRVAVLLVLVTQCLAVQVHVDPAANAGGDGSAGAPFTRVAQALESALATRLLKAVADEPIVIVLAAGAVIEEAFCLTAENSGGADVPVIVTSDPSNPAIVRPGAASLTKSLASAGASYTIYNRGNVTLQNTIYDGSGSGKSSIVIWADNGRYSNITIRNCEIRNGDEHGIFMGGASGSGFSTVLFEDCTIHHNKRDGINTWGEVQDCLRGVTVRRCTFNDNYGLASQSNPTGSGCVLGMVDGGLIEYCTAFNNGKNNTNSAGPVGIWTYDSRAVVIQFCESYNNRTSGGDGGGFDIDGGCTACIIQYCYSHGNDGPGYLYAQYDGADDFRDNIIRYNISENDCRKGGKGAITIWGFTGNAYGARLSAIYGNTVYVTAAAGGTNSAILFWDKYSGITVRNNIFYLGSAGLNATFGANSGVTFDGNCWYGASVNVTDPHKVTADPKLTSPGGGGTVGTANLGNLSAYKLQSSSPCINAGVSITGSGDRDFYGNTVPNGAFDIGAHEFMPGTQSLRDPSPRHTSDRIFVQVREREREMFSLDGRNIIAAGREVSPGVYVGTGHAAAPDSRVHTRTDRR